ncbi:hypothetical protein WN72_44770 [Bradyrhizobium arachidis]|uniref:Uncharacterized protein n=1 Tax=Bradyrhizobium arachidis TaxID=858423 RepID=A0AAE7TMV7_9BRAD|nr:hypothetical protein WN72_44770 [Bradyrhizobium arachidis]
MISVVVAAALVAGHAAEAKGKRHGHHSVTPAAEQRSTGQSTHAQPRDPADIALEKKIKSICRGC